MTLPLEPLGKYVNVIGGFAFKSEHFSEDGIPVIRISDIQDGSVLVDNVARIPKSCIGKGERYTIKAGDILIAMSGATTGKIGIVPQGVHEPILQNQRVGNFKIIVPEKIHKPYLKHYLCSLLYQSQIWSTMVGAAQPNISSKQLESITVPIPPIHEQRRIASILDQADALRAKRREALAQLDSLTQSIFIEMFGDPIRNPKGWQVTTLASNSQRIQIGPFGSQLHEEDYIEGGIPLINPTHIQNGKILPNWKLTVSKDKYSQLSQYHLAQGDIVLGRRGEMGRCSVITDIEHGWLCGTGSLFIRPNTKVIAPTYLGHVISSLPMKRYLENVAQGVTMANLNKGIVGGLPIPIPPLSVQLEFGARLEALEKLHESSDCSLKELETLFASLQHQAFRGELLCAHP